MCNFAFFELFKAQNYKKPSHSCNGFRKLIRSAPPPNNRSKANQRQEIAAAFLFSSLTRSRREQFSITPHAMWGTGKAIHIIACRKHALILLGIYWFSAAKKCASLKRVPKIGESCESRTSNGMNNSLPGHPAIATAISAPCHCSMLSLRCRRGSCS